MVASVAQVAQVRASKTCRWKPWGVMEKPEQSSRERRAWSLASAECIVLGEIVPGKPSFSEHKEACAGPLEVFT